jgi:predicted nuclease with TOPRIM domain
MTQNPTIVSYTLEEVLGQINQKLDRLQEDITDLKTEQTKLQGEFQAFKTEIKGDLKSLGTELKGEIKSLEKQVQGLSERLTNQEFINRSIVVGLVLALVMGAAKLFFLV